MAVRINGSPDSVKEAEETRKSGRNFLLRAGGTLTTCLGISIGSMLYPNPYQGVVEPYNNIQETISNLEATSRSQNPSVSFYDPIIQRDLEEGLQTPEKRKSIETALERAYEIKTEIEDSAEFDSYNKIRALKKTGFGAGFVILILSGFYSIYKSEPKRTLYN